MIMINDNILNNKYPFLNSTYKALYYFRKI